MAAQSPTSIPTAARTPAAQTPAAQTPAAQTPAEDGFARSRVAIVGLGLMGGSLAAALSSRRACDHVVGIARRESTLERALEMRFIHTGTTDLAEGLRGADLVILATPVRDIIARLGEIGPLLKKGCVVSDLGSTKGDIVRAMATLPAHVDPIGGHPMCGKESSGLAAADPALYRDRVWVPSPLSRTSSHAVGFMEALVRGVGARALHLDPCRHDRLVAAISHLPYALAVALVNAARQTAGEDDLTWRLAASGFRDTSRLAAGDLTMMLDILLTNRVEVLRALRAAQNELDTLIEQLEAEDADALRAVLATARQQRLEVYG
jgi:prephenate dehydrogenase